MKAAMVTTIAAFFVAYFLVRGPPAAAAIQRHLAGVKHAVENCPKISIDRCKIRSENAYSRSPPNGAYFQLARRAS